MCTQHIVLLCIHVCLAANTVGLELGTCMCEHLHELPLPICTAMRSVLEKGYTEKLNILCPIGYTLVHVRITEKVARASVLLPLPFACNSYLNINITLEVIRISTSNVSSCTGRQPVPPPPPRLPHKILFTNMCNN